MATKAQFFPSGLDSKEFSKARKQMLLQATVDQSLWDKANSRQRDILHNIELTVQSISEDELKNIKY
jgi:hypothetical protein